MPQYPYGPVNTDLGTVATLTAAGSGTVNSNQYTNSVGVGLVVRAYLTAESGTSPTLAMAVQGYDPASGEWWTVASFAATAAAANTMYTLTVYPSATAVTSGDNQVVNAALPLYYRIAYTIAGTTPSLTGTIGGCTLI